MNKVFAFATALLLAGSTAVFAGPEAGDKSFTISGTGSSDQDFDGSAYGVSGELGYYTNGQLMLGVRQSVNGLVGDEVSNEWAGSTRGFVDYHFLSGKWRPYIGANIGGVYGESVSNSGSAGLEAGLKYYVLDKTFIGFGAEYQFLFEDSDDFDNSFNDGAYFYTLGIGFNF